jgi:hypothetical protein
MNRKPDQRSKQRIVLSSGRAIEVTHVDGRTRARDRGRDAPYQCPRCRSELLQPVSWHELADERWQLTLECPDCWWSGETVYGSDQVTELEQRFEDGLSTLLREFKQLTNARAAEDLERFIAALHADLILPEDF